jgi:hypothetical protein
MLLDEMHRLFSEQKNQIESRFAEADRKLDLRFADSNAKLEQRFAAIDDSITKRINEVDDAFNKRFSESDLDWERRITDSEVRHLSLITASEKHQDDPVDIITKATSDIQSWRQESEGTVHNLKLKVDKLTRYWDQSVLDNTMASIGLISPSPPTLE